MKTNDNFIDHYSFEIGIFAIVMVGIAAIGFGMSNRTRGMYASDSDEPQSSVEDRIRPFGQVYLPGEEIDAGGPRVDEAEQAKPVATVLSGPQVYNAACIICHGSGIGGAPTIGDSALWQSRVAQGKEILYSHAIEGYTGSTGFMPQKGGRIDLSDDEIRGAVDFMVSELQL